MRQIRQRVQRPRTARNAEKWHQDVTKAQDVLDNLMTEYPLIESVHLESLQLPTTDYLRGWNGNQVRSSTECDEILGRLIDEHAKREYLARDVAIFACLYALSIPAATRYLLSLIDLNVKRYLRCIILAGRIKPSVASSEELHSAQALLGILSGQDQDIQNFQQVIETLGLNTPLIFIPLRIIHSALEISGICSRLQRQLDSHLEQKRFMSAFNLVSWLQRIPRIPNNDDVIAVLERHFPSWPWMILWRPNTERISRWEDGKFTDVQRNKLSHAFDLDGPDTATHLQESLKFAEPWCYEHIRVQQRSTGTLERYLDLLFRAHFLGPGALELFIHLCIDGTPNETALSMAEDAINIGEDSHCIKLLVILRALTPHSSLSFQMRSLTQALPVLQNYRLPDNIQPLADRLVDHLNGVMEAAKAEFCTQLEKGTGEVMGMLIRDLGKAILEASWIHSNLSSDLLAQIQQIPPQDTLEAIFDKLQDHVESSNAGHSRFKSYLTSALGGKSNAEAELMTLAAIQEEVQFWKYPPDTSRKDLAKTLAKFRSMEYSLYTSCLLEMLQEDDLFIREMQQKITLENEFACLNFANYLTRRRRLNQLRHECWLLLLASLIREQVPSFLPRLADSMTFDQWLKLVDDLTRLVTPIRSQLPRSGTGLTQERLAWWEMLSQNIIAMRILLDRQDGQGNLTWLYFPSPGNHIMDLLARAEHDARSSPDPDKSCTR
jgi:hypothetical protein